MTGADDTDSDPPSNLLLFAEWRALIEVGLGLASLPLLLTAPRGDGHPVLVLPGFMAGDVSTELLRRYLTLQGYGCHPWDFGRNIGGAYRFHDRLCEKLGTLHRDTGRRVSLVGWSLGGAYARNLALTMPETVRYVITLGSPFANYLKGVNPLIRSLYEQVTGETPTDLPLADREKLQGDLPVPTTALFSRTDGVVHWRSATVRENHRAENIEVLSSHFGFGFNPAVLWAVADRLAQPEGTFSEFARGGPFRFAFRN